MPKALRVEEILAQASKLERKYRWFRAIRSYKKALFLVPERDVWRRGEIHELLGYAFLRIAMQAESIEEFKTRCAQSIEYYEKAKELYGKKSGSTEKPLILRCNAFIAYLIHWLKSEVREKERFLDECWRATKEALNGFEETGDAWEYGKTYNQLSVSALFRFFYDWNFQNREGTVREAAHYGEKAIRYLSNFGDPYELARAYVRTATYREMLGFYFLDLGERESDYQKALDYWLKANELSEEAAHVELLNSGALAALESLSWEWGTDTTLTNFFKALKYGRKTKDRLIIGWTLDWLAFHTLFNAEARENPEEMVELFEKALQYSKDAKQQYLPISYISPLWGSLWAEAPYAYYYWYLATYEADPERKCDLLKKAAEAASDQLKLSEGSGYPEILMFAHHTSSDIFLSLARIERNSYEKKRLLEKALMHQNEAGRIIGQFIPFYYWKRGKMQTFVADIKSELAELAKDHDVKKIILQEAVLDKENSLKLATMYAEFWEGKGSIPALFANLGNWKYGYGDMLNRLYELTENSEHLRKALAIFEEASKAFEKLNLSSRMAECYWKIGQTCDTLGEHLRAARNFSTASSNYLKAAEGIPQLKDFYQEHAFYMQTWSEIEKARHHHRRLEYRVAMEHFEKAAEIHKSLKHWGYLASSYSAWALLENAEELSRNEQSEEALTVFEQAAKLFQETKESLQKNLSEMEDSHEKLMITHMKKAAGLRAEYCRARITIEEARIFDKKGEHATSASKYADAQEPLQKIAEKETEQTRRELQILVFLCQAWEKMMMAEAKASSTMYGEAARLFERAKEYVLDKQTSLLALANSSFCRALAAGTEFESTRNAKLYSMSKKHMEAAANYYLKAGLISTSEYVRATQRLFDAYMYMNEAQTDTRPQKKMQYYQLAEKLLQASAYSYWKAKHPEKSEEIKRLLESVREEKRLVISLTTSLRSSVISSTTAAFLTPTPSYEKAVGLERFEHTDIQAHLTASPEAVVGENLEVRLDLVNVAKNLGLLIKVDNLTPRGFRVVNMSPQYKLENGSIDMKGKKLEALKVETIKIFLEPTEAGVAYLCPEVVYTDDAGSFKTCRPNAVKVTIHAPLSFKFKTDAARMVFDYLVHAFVKDYMSRRLFIEEAGWRSMVQIVKNACVSFRSVYGNGRRRGSAISELERRGLIETRIFSGKRGRGGKITKVRISYAKETIKRYIDAKVARGPEPTTLNVLEVVLPGRIATGCLDLDNLLYGGMPENYAVVLTSPSCDERDLLIKKFLETGVKDGQATFYVTIEASGVRALVEEFQSHFYLFICNPRADTMIKSLPNVFKLKGVENLTDIDIALMSAFRRLDASSKIGQRRACIEIVSDVLLQHHAVHTRRWLTGLIPDLRSRGFTALAVMNPYMHSSEEVHAILGLFDGEINIYEKETTKGLEKFIKVKKMYNQRYLENELPLRKERLEK